MALYSASELQSKISGGKREMREFEPKENKLYNIWIPRDTFLYIKKHFNLHSVPVCKKCRLKAITCINTDPSAPKQKCLVCDYIEEKWQEYKKASTKDKKIILQTINKLGSEYIYANGIDTEDPDLKFQAFRFTKSIMESISLVTATIPIENVIWQYKKTNKNNKISYIIIESENHPKALELAEQYEVLSGREFKDGGLVDLEMALLFKTNEKDYNNLLAGKAKDDDDTEDDTEDDTDILGAGDVNPSKKDDDVEIDEGDDIDLDDIAMDDEPEKPKATPKATPKTTKKAEPVIEDAEIVESDDLELEDIDLEDEEKPVETKKTTTDTSDDIDLDDLELEDIDLEDEVEMVDVTAASLNENKKEKGYVNAVVNYLVKEGAIKISKDYATNLKAAYAHLKTNKLTIQVSQTDIDLPF